MDPKSTSGEKLGPGVPEPVRDTRMSNCQMSLSGEVAKAASAMLEKLLTIIAGRVYSPRIKLLSLDQVTEATGLSERTIYRLVETGKFPKPQKNLGKNTWRESAIIVWADANDPNQHE